MREMWVIAKRELLERVRTKWFVAMTILGPILMVALIVIPVLLASSGATGAKVAIVDETGQLGDKLVAMFAGGDQHWQAHVVPPATPEADLMAQLRAKQLSGFLHIPKDAFEQTGEIVYRGDNATNQMVQVELRIDITKAMLDTRGRAFHLSDDQLAQLLMPPTIRALHTNGTTEGESGEATFFLGYIIALILYMVITLYGVNVMRSVVTEKSSRVVELMVAATKPSSMMAGKILGVGGAGLAKIGIWLAVGGIALANRDALLSHFGAAAAASALPTLGGLDIAVIIAFFAVGFLFYSTMYAAVGAMVASEQDSAQAQIPVTMLLVIGMVSMTAITGDPRGHTAEIMTQVPFWSPMLMPLRYLLGGASLADVGLSLGILCVSMALIARAAAKIYRVGILMYGKRPSLRELVRWLRY